jgi:hypothetical protein
MVGSRYLVIHEILFLLSSIMFFSVHHLIYIALIHYSLKLHHNCGGLIDVPLLEKLFPNLIKVIMTLSK